jgi:PAS domain S-box-containing protein
MKNGGVQELIKLRSKAEEICNESCHEQSYTGAYDVAQLLHEIEIQRTEIKLQNQELVKSREENRMLSDKLLVQDLRKSEQKYRLLIENSCDAIYLLKSNNTFEYVNQRFCDLTGYTYDEITSEEYDISNLLAGHSVNVLSGGWKKAEPNRWSVFETQLKNNQGQWVDVEISASAITIGQQLVIMGVVREISERKRNEKLLRDFTVAQHSLKFKQKFLSHMSHEIRTPLTGILGMAELLSITGLNAIQQDYLNTLRLSTEQLIDIINQILDYSKIEAGKIQLRKSTFPFQSLLDGALRFFQGICRKDIELVIETDAAMPEIVEADEVRLRQVLHNLLSNAVKFTLKGRITIKASIEKWINDRNFYATISVSDTGIGIQKDFLSLLFHPFEQSEKTRREIYFEGTGLGLPICKELVELMGGHITAESIEGRGSIFSFSFIAQSVHQEQKPPVTPIPGEKVRILFAEDKEINRKVVGLLLESMGHEVSFAVNGQEAVNMFVPGKYDLILMDIQMPVMDGVTATQTLRKRYKNLPPIVAITANAFEGDKEKYMALGMDDYIAKPVSADDLRLLVARFI